MGKNYYFCANDTNNQWHIGKSSHGWEFVFQAQPELDIYSKKQWGSFLFDKVPLKGTIRDEYDHEYTFDDFFKQANHANRLEQCEFETLKSHYREQQLKEFEQLKLLRLEHGIPVEFKLEEVEPSNCWVDIDGYSIILSKFS